MDLQALSIEKADMWILINDSKTAAVPLENRNDSNNVTPRPTDMYLMWVWHYELSLCGGFDHDHSLIFQSRNPIDILVSQIGVCEPQSQGRQHKQQTGVCLPLELRVQLIPKRMHVSQQQCGFTYIVSAFRIITVRLQDTACSHCNSFFITR